jgi:acetaldehyde dehydrogenase
MHKIKAAIIGSGNIGTDLMLKIDTLSDTLEMVAMIGVDPDSEGLAIARSRGKATTHAGIAGLLELDAFADIDIVFDATSARAHHHHDAVLGAHGKMLVDLTPAAIGPFVVPSVNLGTGTMPRNVNMVTCGGQATVPIVAAVSAVTKVHYAEIVASIASRSAGPGTRANIDEFTETTASALERLGGATRGKAIIVLNPAEPPMMMRDTVYCLCDAASTDEITASIEAMVEDVRRYVPGYRLFQAVQFEPVGGNSPIDIPDLGRFDAGLKVTVFLEVEGAGHYLPRYAGNLDIMTSAALRVGERYAASRNWAA